jgi:hypothetical protein
VSSIRASNIFSAVSWSIKTAFGGTRTVADAKLIWHAEIKPCAPESYAGGIVVQKDFEIRHDRQNIPGWTIDSDLKINHSPLLENRLLHVHGLDTDSKTQVSLIGNEREKRGLLEEIPGDAWQDIAARMPCPARRKFMPLGSLMCSNWNCNAAFFYLQHRFTARAERVIIPKEVKLNPRKVGNSSGTGTLEEGASSNSQAQEAESGFRNDVRAATAQVSEHVNTFVARGQRYGTHSQLSPERQFYQLAQQENVQIAKHEGWKQRCPFGSFDPEHTCYMTPMPAVT